MGMTSMKSPKRLPAALAAIAFGFAGLTRRRSGQARAGLDRQMTDKPNAQC